MKLAKYSFLLEAETPIAHHSEVLGNAALFMRQKVRRPDGSFEEVPYLTGDACRHQLREAASYAFLAAAGIADKGTLCEGALRLLFNGGMLTGRGDGATVNLTEYAKLCDLYPPLALFGGCVSNRSVPGRLIVDEAILVCEENAHRVPPSVLSLVGQVSEAGAHLEERTRVRMDATLDPQKRALLTAGARGLVEQRLLSSEKASTDKDAKGASESKSSMMPRSFEALCAGSLFYWRAEARCMSDLDEDTFKVAIAAWLTNATVGGKKGSGHGRLRVKAAFESKWEPLAREEFKSSDLAQDGVVGQLFRAHVTARREDIGKWLALEVNA